MQEAKLITNKFSMPRSRVSVAALAASFVLFASLISAEHIEFDVWHRLGSDDADAENSKWRAAGTLSGEVDTAALVDAAAAALRGGGGRISPPPKSASPVLTLVRDEKNAITVEEAQKAAERGQGYSIKLKRKLDRSSATSKTKTKNSNAALFTSAPPHCAAAALSGALPLKLDGSLPRRFSSSYGEGGGGIRVTGVSFDFYGGGCNKHGAKAAPDQTARSDLAPRRGATLAPAAASARGREEGGGRGGPRAGPSRGGSEASSKRRKGRRRGRRHPAAGRGQPHLAAEELGLRLTDGHDGDERDERRGGSPTAAASAEEAGGSRSGICCCWGRCCWRRSGGGGEARRRRRRRRREPGLIETRKKKKHCNLFI